MSNVKDLLGQALDAPPHPDPVAAVRRRAARARRGRATAAAIVSAGVVVGGAVVGPSLLSHADQDDAVRFAKVRPAYQGTIPSSLLDRLRKPEERPSTAAVAQVVPTSGVLQLGVYTSRDGRPCTVIVIDSTGFSADCKTNDLNPAWNGIHVRDGYAPGAPPTIYGYLPADADALTVQVEDGPERPLPLYRGPAGFEGFNFFMADGSLTTGEADFRGYSADGDLRYEERVGERLPVPRGK